MIKLMKSSIYMVASMVLLALFAVSCNDDDDSTYLDNTIEGSEGVGMKRLSFDLPAISKLIVVSGLDGVILEMKGVDDMQTYDITADITLDGDVISICAEEDEDLSAMPHQEYYLNFIKFYSNDSDSTRGVSDDERSIILGVLIDILDPNNIDVKSKYDEVMECFGSGSEDDPYSIVTILCVEALILDKLTTATDELTFQNVYFRQTRDINFKEEYALFDGWTAMGKFNTNGVKPSFCGVFDGGRNIIQELLVYSDSSSALFYSLGDGAIIRNIKMTDLDIDGGLYAGAIACMSSGDVLIDNVDVYGDVRGAGSVGGMIGEGSATFNDCYVSMDIRDNGDCSDDSVTTAIGGFIGNATGDCSFDVCAYAGAISNSSDDSYDGGGYIGSVADDSAGHNISFVNCAVAGTIGSSSFDNVGGLIGYCGSNSEVLVDDVIIGSELYMDVNNASTESIFGDSPIFSTIELTLYGNNVGGYIGKSYNFSSMNFCGYKNCVSNLVTIKSLEYIGGVIGYNSCSTSSSSGEITVYDCLINNSLMSTYITGAADIAYFGGFVGYSSGMNLMCSNSLIVNDPVAILYYKGETILGSFAGEYIDGTLTDVCFTNYSATAVDYFGDTTDTPDLSSSTFLVDTIDTSSSKAISSSYLNSMMK